MEPENQLSCWKCAWEVPTEIAYCARVCSIILMLSSREIACSSESCVAYFFGGDVCVVSRIKVDIRRLQKFAFSELPRNSVLRNILLAEAREVEVSTFLERLPVWLQLSVLEQGGER